MSKQTVFSNIALGEVSIVSNTKSGTAALPNAQHGSTITAGSSTGTAPITIKGRAQAILDANATQLNVSNKPILPKTKQMQTTSDLGVMDTVENIYAPAVDAYALIFDHCVLREDAVKGKHLSASKEIDKETCDCGCCDCEDDSFWSCDGGTTKSPVEGGGYVDSSILDTIASTASAGIRKTIKAIADGTVGLATASKNLYCNMSLSLSLDDSSTILDVAGTKEADAAINKLAMAAGKKGNVSFLSKLNQTIPSAQLSAVVGSHARPIFGKSISTGNLKQLKGLNALNATWENDIQPGDIDSTASYKNISESQEKAVRTSLMVNNNPVVTA